MNKINCILFIASSVLLAACNGSGSSQSNSSPKNVTTYAYVVNSGNNSYTKCLVSESNALSSCSTAIVDNFSKPTGIAFNTKYAYVINNDDHSYVRCSILSDGTLDECEKDKSDLLNKPLKIAFKSNYAYIINDESSVYTKCSIGDQGFLDDCNDTPIVGVLNILSDIGFDGNYAYITNSTGGHYQCSVNNSGDLTDCIRHPSGLLNLPSSIAFNNNKAYMTYMGVRSHYAQCEINQSNGNLQCQDPSLLNAILPTDIAFNNNTAYILSGEDNSYTQCLVSSNGSLIDCNKSKVEGFNEPFSIGFHSIDNNITPPPPVNESQMYIYMIDHTKNGYMSCVVGESNGVLSDCHSHVPLSSDGSYIFNLPTDISFQNNKAYISNYFSNSYTQCNVGKSGVLNQCEKIAESSTFASDGVVINNNLLYFVNQRSAGSYGLCQISGNGDLANCAALTPSIDGISQISSPSSLAFKNGYAYFLNYTGKFKNSYTKCVVGGTGELNMCSVVPLSELSNPSSIAFNQNYTYIANEHGDKSYTLCGVDISGELVRCYNPANVTGLNLAPTNIAFNNNYAYITYANNTSSKCSVAINGELTDCTNSVIHGSSNLWGIGFYAYESGQAN